ncbi:Phage gp6-like head-tail connector protein [Roseovarius litorisediminis]|uniref:Phage gp6-like head-tail connector protein n=1 Tax=Roseovarius litorisediminis TaxID=1312363 RepID=A0A1Y5TK37_9RHOB|nr:head-tail connector protein [Roseovarius litorisediminis]SLN62285.1 Phage gp6-like head-tail connector protein [Roseovarius litorisediminis]
MAALTPVALLKSQLNLDHDLDDALLAHKLDAAEIWIGNHTGVAFAAGDAALTEAALQLAAYWYEQREAASFEGSGRPVPFGVRDLLNSYRESVTGYVAP